MAFYEAARCPLHINDGSIPAEIDGVDTTMKASFWPYFFEPSGSIPSQFDWNRIQNIKTISIRSGMIGRRAAAMITTQAWQRVRHRKTR